MISLLVLLNSIANACAALLFAPIAWVPGWVSATAVSVITGVLMLLAFKYTSYQTGIKRTRNQIKANLLALSLFKDNVAVGLRAQGRLLANAGKLLLLSIVPMLVMTLPMILLLGQLALWYQARPLRVGEEAVVTVQLASDAANAVREIELVTQSGIETTTGPVRVSSKHFVCWKIRPTSSGTHELVFRIGEQSYRKQLATGDGYMPTSLKRPAWSVADILMHPRESPFARDSMVQSIDVAFPERESWTTGSSTWLIYWFVMSMIAAFAAKPILKVNL
jgi:uncharacterized membrane protein (DUF106 family)